jgi:hypothetical protein
MARKPSYKIVEKTLKKAFGKAYLKKGFPKTLEPAIESVATTLFRQRDDTYSKNIYTFTAIVDVEEFPTESQMQWWQMWKKELNSITDTTTLEIDGVFIDEYGRLIYVFTGGMAK